MKKFLLVPALVGVLVLTGCSMQKGLSQDELFEKKKECASYKNIIDKEINEKNSGSWTRNLESIFYSPIKNTCMYYAYGYVTYENKEGEYQTRDSLRVYDYFTKEEVLSTPITCKDYDGKTISYTIGGCLEDNFQEKLKELKGE